MSVEAWLDVLRSTYDEAFENLGKVLRECPDELWLASVWEVRLHDRHVWPVIRGMGSDLPDGERLQLYSAFCNVAYHLLFFADYYLGDVDEPSPPAPFRPAYEPHVLPERAYTREELLGYVDHCRERAEAVLGGLTEEAADGPGRNRWSLAETLVRNLVQITDHTAHLTLFLNLRAGWSDSRWTTASPRFRRCEYCPETVG